MISHMQLICSSGQTIQKGEKISHVQKLHLKAIKPDVFDGLKTNALDSE